MAKNIFIQDSNPSEVTREMIGNDSLEWETSEGWQQWVVQPVHKFPMAPRWALAILIKSGQLFSRGVHINRILEKLDEI